MDGGREGGMDGGREGGREGGKEGVIYPNNPPMTDILEWCRNEWQTLSKNLACVPSENTSIETLVLNGEDNKKDESSS